VKVKRIVLCTLAMFILTIAGCAHSNFESEQNTNEIYAEIEKNTRVKDMATVFIEEPESQKTLQSVSVYFLNESQNELVPELREIELPLEDSIFSFIVKELEKGPVSIELQTVIPVGTSLLSAFQNENVVTVDLSYHFLETEDIRVALASLVNSFVAVEGIEFVRLLIEGESLTLSPLHQDINLGMLSRFPNDLKETLSLDVVDDEESMRSLDWELYFQDRDATLLLSETRSVNVQDKRYARAIIEELIKGPSLPDMGLYRAISADIRVLDIIRQESFVLEKKDELRIYFSEEFKSVLRKSFEEQKTVIGTLVFSLLSLNNLDRLEIFFKNGERFEQFSLNISSELITEFKKVHFEDLLGRRIRIFFSDQTAMNLVPEFRAMNRKDLRIARKIISELIEGPMNEGNRPVMPVGFQTDEIRVWIQDRVAYVDLPEDISFYNGGEVGETMTIYAIVNSLADPLNSRTIDKVQFLVGGVMVEGIGELSLVDPFIRKPILVKDE